MPNIPFHLIDSFTDVPFRGNPAGVVWLDLPREAKWMQSVAMEVNQAETAFICPAAEGFSLRWFTPTVEVELCGHATLAAAHFLWDTERLSRQSSARFLTQSGWLTCHIADKTIAMDFPVIPVQATTTPPLLFESLSLNHGETYKNGMDYLVHVADAKALRAMKPNHSHLEKVQGRGVIVTARSDVSEYDFISRFFAPQSGIPEDPVTGSAHCALGPFWAAKLGKSKLTGFQASPRGGRVQLEVLQNRVKLMGTAVTVIRGELISDDAS